LARLDEAASKWSVKLLVWGTSGKKFGRLRKHFAEGKNIWGLLFRNGVKERGGKTQVFTKMKR